ncbi:hypothetical protein [Pedobacter sp. L105]|uniref:hypothetical protein n=1 Tax=Pedobacter sp. L105 TaxID=1641871 RepID=UPI00131BDA55|nr:hypothetical protein [Pedobacter sp. L105]
MKLILLLFVCLNPFNSDLSAYRKLLDGAVDNKEVANELYTRLKTVKESDTPVLVGFRAMSEFMICKHLFNPFNRISHFNKGKRLLEMAIKRDKNNPELLYFRLSTQSNIPSFLGYNSNIDTDKLALISYLKSAATHPDEDNVLNKRIKAYLLKNQYCSIAEKALIKTL